MAQPAAPLMVKLISRPDPDQLRDAGEYHQCEWLCFLYHNGRESLGERRHSRGNNSSHVRISTATSLVSFNPHLYFINNGSQLWTSEAERTGGTVEVAAHWRVAQLTAGATRLFFSAADSSHGTELWTSDGTAAGTAILSDIDPGTASSNPAGFHGSVRNKRIFSTPTMGFMELEILAKRWYGRRHRARR